MQRQEQETRASENSEQTMQRQEQETRAGENSEQTMQRQEQDRKLAEGFRGGSRIDGRGVLRRGIFCATPTDDVIFAQRHFLHTCHSD